MLQISKTEMLLQIITEYCCTWGLVRGGWYVWVGTGGCYGWVVTCGLLRVGCDRLARQGSCMTS